MARKLDAQEPLLTAVARKLGQAAGTLVNMSQMLTTEPTPESHVASTPKSTKPGKTKRTNKRRTARVQRTSKSRKPSASNRSTSKRGSARQR